MHDDADDGLACMLLGLTCLDDLQLRYEVGWPLSVVLGARQLQQYNKINCFLLKLKHVMFLLRQIWEFMQLNTQKKNVHSREMRELQLLW